MGYEYNTVSDVYISAKLNSALREPLYTLCYNLSSMLGDDGGKINPTNIKQITKGLNITFPGVVLLGEVTPSSPTEVDQYIEEVYYINEVSNRAYELYVKYTNNDSSVTLVDNFDTTINSPMLMLSSNSEPTHRSAISALYLDCMVLYHEMLEATPENGLETVTLQDLFRIDNNIRWLTQELERKLYKNYELIEVLRELQLTLMFVRSVSSLFTTTYINKVFNSSQDEVL